MNCKSRSLPVEAVILTTQAALASSNALAEPCDDELPNLKESFAAPIQSGGILAKLRHQFLN
jgi:hypothetical protein